MYRSMVPYAFEALILWLAKSESPTPHLKVGVFPNDPHVVVHYFVLSFLPGVTILSLANLTTI